MDLYKTHGWAIIGASLDTDMNFGTVSSHIEPSTWIHFTFFGY